MSQAGGAATPVDPEDARILALETGPIRGHTVKLLLVADAPGPPAVPELGAAIEASLVAEPRWRQRLVPDPSSGSGLSWCNDPSFSIARHVRMVEAAVPPDEPGLRRLVAQAMMAPLDRAQPLWELGVIPRLADGRWALIWKVHHCLADGTTAMRAGSRLIWTQQPPGGDRAAGGRRRSPPGPAGQRKTGGRLALLAGYRGLLLREFRRAGSLSPFAADVGLHREVASARCALRELHALGKAIAPEVTVNDVLLAVVTGALQHWLHGHGGPVAALKAQVPVSMHLDGAGGEPGGNRDSFLLVTLPIGESDPIARVRAIASATSLRKNRHDARAIYALQQRIAHVPGPLRRMLQRAVQGPHEYSLNVSNVPGPAAPIYVLGRRVDELYSIAEIAPRHALRVAAISLAGSLFIGLCADPGAVPDLDVIAAGIPLAISELRARLPP
jgi:diacylglycerol O-acyltransferase / wax synthase